MYDGWALGKCQNNVRVRVSGPRCQNVAADQVTDTSRVTKPKITWLQASRWHEWSEFQPFNSSYRQSLTFNNENGVIQWNQPKQGCLYKSINFTEILIPKICVNRFGKSVWSLSWAHKRKICSFIPKWENTDRFARKSNSILNYNYCFSLLITVYNFNTLGFTFLVNLF